MGLLTVLLSLSSLGVDGVVWITFAPTCTTIPVAMSIVAAGPMILTSTVAPLPDMTLDVSPVSMQLLIPPVRVGTPTPTTALPLPSACVGLVNFPAGFKKADVILSHMSTEGLI